MPLSRRSGQSQHGRSTHHRHAAQKSWRKLDGQNQLPKVIKGIKFTDGIEIVNDHAAA